MRFEEAEPLGPTEVAETRLTAYDHFGSANSSFLPTDSWTLRYRRLTSSMVTTTHLWESKNSQHFGSFETTNNLPLDDYTTFIALTPVRAIIPLLF